MVQPITRDMIDLKTDLTWQQHMKNAIRTSQGLASALDLPLSEIDSGDATQPFPLFAPLPFVSRMEPGNIEDPLLRQVLPVAEEKIQAEGYLKDPLKEDQFSISPGLLHKYDSRALMIINGTCAVHCRYCFRRNFPYQESLQSTGDWDRAIQQIESDVSVHEIILSGGDPLTVVDDRLTELVQRLDQIQHLQRLRIHTRLPIVIPQRITGDLIETINETRMAITIVVHANHANEVDESVAHHLGRLSQTRATVLNQSVLLRGINDDPSELIELSQRLIACGTVPYYLHQLDPVIGAQHFHVPIQQGREIIKEMRTRISGYLVPRYVQERPGQPNKTPLE